jgi:hypothetical protein
LSHNSQNEKVNLKHDQAKHLHWSYDTLFTIGCRDVTMEKKDILFTVGCRDIPMERIDSLIILLSNS